MNRGSNKTDSSLETNLVQSKNEEGLEKHELDALANSNNTSAVSDEDDDEKKQLVDYAWLDDDSDEWQKGRDKAIAREKKEKKKKRLEKLQRARARYRDAVVERHHSAAASESEPTPAELRQRQRKRSRSPSRPPLVAAQSQLIPLQSQQMGKNGLMYYFHLGGVRFAWSEDHQSFFPHDFESDAVRNAFRRLKTNGMTERAAAERRALTGDNKVDSTDWCVSRGIAKACVEPVIFLLIFAILGVPTTIFNLAAAVFIIALVSIIASSVCVTGRANRLKKNSIEIFG